MKKLSCCLLMMPLLLAGCSDSTATVYTVNFDSQGGTPVESQRVKKGGKIFKPTDPTKAENTFNYWSYEGKEWSFINDVVTSDMTLKAVWVTPCLVTASYDNEKGSVTGCGAYHVGKEVTLTATPIGDNDFGGWYSDEEFTNCLTKATSYTFTMPNHNVCYYAKFTENAEKRERDIAHGIIPNVDLENKTITYGLYPQNNVNDTELISALNQLTEPGINGWYLYEDTYYAKTIANPYYSAHNFDNGTEIVAGAEYWFKCEPIKWNILSADKNEFFILTSKLLDAHRFDPETNNYANSDAEDGTLSEQTITGPSKLGALLAKVYIKEQIDVNVKLHIAPNAFADNTNLQQLVIDGNVAEIGEKAFIRCTNLKTINVEERDGEIDMEYIDKNAFDTCTNLQTFIFNGKNDLFSLMDVGCFANCPNFSYFDLGGAKEFTWIMWRASFDYEIEHVVLYMYDRVAGLFASFGINSKWVRAKNN